MPNSKVSQDHTLILLVLLMYAQFAYGKYAVELAGLKVVLPQDGRKTMSMAMADFGLPKYGGILKWVTTVPLILFFSMAYCLQKTVSSVYMRSCLFLLTCRGNLVYPTSESGYPNGGLVCKPEGCQFGCSRLNVSVHKAVLREGCTLLRIAQGSEHTSVSLLQESTPQFLLKRQPGMLNIVMLNRGPSKSRNSVIACTATRAFPPGLRQVWVLAHRG